MRILQVNTINQVANLYGARLEHLGHEVTLYEPSLSGGHAPWPVKAALLPGRVLSLRQIVGRLTPETFDIAHIHWASYGLLGLMGRLPFVLHCHGSDVRERLHSPAFRLLLTPMLRRASAVLCISPDLLALTRSLRPDAHFFPAPVDTDHFAPAATRADRPWTVLLFARLEPGKGVEPAAQGLARFAARHPETRILLLDYGVLSQEFQRRYSARFQFVPRVAPDAVRSLIWGADVVVGQLAVGALGLSELQAMSCAKPVIAAFRFATSYATPPPLLQAASAEEVDAHLERLYQRPAEATAIGAAARRWVIAEHDRDLLALRLEDLYHRILAGG